MKNEKIKSVDELDIISKKIKSEGKKIITTNGVFDIIHIGHIRYLQEAKRLGDILIIGVNSDNSVKRIKDSRRPINNEDDRAEVLAALECVNYVTIFNENDPINFLSVIKPDIHVKGGDYGEDEIIEKDTVNSNGGKIELLPLIGGYSTTNFIKEIVKKYKDD